MPVNCPHGLGNEDHDGCGIAFQTSNVVNILFGLCALVMAFVLSSLPHKTCLGVVAILVAWGLEVNPPECTKWNI
jgi:hypothetical protein